MSTFITRSRLIGLASASAIFGSMALAAMPASAMAAACAPTGFTRDGIDLTAAQINGAVTGELDATGCDIAVYNPTNVTNADIHGARYFGIVVNGGTVNTTNSMVHQIGENPFDGAQHGRAILYINGASGTISNNNVYDFQKNGIEVRGVTADASAPSSHMASATIVGNVITGQGPVDYIAQNGIVVLGNASATVKGNDFSALKYTGPADTHATGLLNVDAKSVTVAGNTFDAVQVHIDGAVNVTGLSTTTVRPHGVRVDLRSDPKPAPEATLGAKLDWKVKVDGVVTFHTRQGFDDHDVVRQHFTTGSGRHVVKVLKNNVVVQRTVVRV